MVHLFPAAAENPRSGRLEIAEGAVTAPGVYVGGDDLTGPASSNADLRGHGQKLERAASSPLLGGDGPVAAPSPDGRLVAYSTWAWTQQADRYRVYGWAGDRLVVTRGREGGGADAEVLDGPAKVRLLAGEAGVLGISPDGGQALVSVGAPGDGGVTLSLRSVADST